MNRSRLVGIAMSALAAVSCSSGPDPSGPDDGGGGHPPVDVTPLLSRAGHSSNDDLLAAGMSQRLLSCKDDMWLAEVYWGPLRPPPLDRMVFVAWDMLTGTLTGWDIRRNDADRSYWSVALSAAEVGFGCNERYSTSFFVLATWGDQNISRAIGFRRAYPGVFSESVSQHAPGMVSYASAINFTTANLQAPDAATYYLKNLFTGATFTTDVPAQDNDSSHKIADLEVDYGKVGLAGVADVAACVVYKREGVGLTNHCLTATDETLP